MSKKKKVSIRLVVFFIIYEILFTLVTAPFYIYRGPFSNLKKVTVGTIMGTRHQYFATKFLSTSEIDEITNKSKLTKQTSKVDINSIHITQSNNKKITRYDLHPSSGRYDGYLLVIPNTYKVKVAYTKKLKIEGEKTSQMAKDHNAIAAINGGAFCDNNQNSYGGCAAFPGGFVISNGEVKFNDSSNDTQQFVTAFTKSGVLVVGKYSLNELRENYDISEAICFRGPALIINGEGQIDNGNAAADGFQPRTAVGQTKDGTILFLVMDGRKNFIKSGATLKDAQDELLKHGACNASYLDGGFSSTMYYNGKVINNPHGWNGERYVATALYVAP